MALLTKPDLLQQLSPPIDGLLASQLIDEYLSIERRFVLRDWEPAELDGGQFCEILARIIYAIDSGNLNLRKDFGECLDYIENSSVTHRYSQRKDLLHLSRVLRVIYKFRSDRGAVHISPMYSPNEMDARLVLEQVRWCFAETLRIFWKGDREAVAAAIRQLIQFDAPCVGMYGDVTIVQRTDLSAEEEILVLLHHAGEAGFTRNEIGRASFSAPSTVTNVLKRLEGSEYRQIVLKSDSRYRLTDLGAKRIREELAEKLRLE